MSDEAELGYCPSCGSERQEAAQFCARCGQRLTAEAAPIEAQAVKPRPRLGRGPLIGLLVALVAVGGVAVFQLTRPQPMAFEDFNARVRDGAGDMGTTLTQILSSAALGALDPAGTMQAYRDGADTLDALVARERSWLATITPHDCYKPVITAYSGMLDAITQWDGTLRTQFSSLAGVATGGLANTEQTQVVVGKVEATVKAIEDAKAACE